MKRLKISLVVSIVGFGFILASCAGAPVREVPEEARLLSVESIDFYQTAALFTQGGQKIEIGEKIEGKKLTFKFSEARRDDKFTADVGQAFLKEFGAVLEKNGIRIAPGAPNRVKISIAYSTPINDADMRYLVAQVSVFRESMLIFQKPFLLTARRTALREVEHEALAGRQLAVSSGNWLAKKVAGYFRGDEK